MKVKHPQLEEGSEYKFRQEENDRRCINKLKWDIDCWSSSDAAFNQTVAYPL